MARAKRGRPTLTAWMAAQTRLKAELAQAYPQPTDRATLARTANITRKAVLNLRNDLYFKAILPNYLWHYLQGLPVTGRGRLTPSWRAVVDLHYYSLLLTYPHVRLPLYRQHALVWGLPLRPDTAHASRRDYQEQRRVFRPDFQQVITRLDWPQARQDLSLTLPESEWPCTSNCPVL